MSRSALLIPLAQSQFTAEWEAQRSRTRLPIDAVTFAELKDLGGDDDGFLRDLLDTYFEQTGSLLAVGRAAAATGSTADFVRAVHTLSGSSRNVGAKEVAHLCAAIEQDAAAADPVHLASFLDLLQEPLSAACNALREHLQPDFG